MFLAVLGMFLIPISMIYLIVTLIKKTFSKKTFSILLVGGIVLFIIGLIISPPTEPDEQEKAVETTKEEEPEEKVQDELQTIDVEIDLFEKVEDGKVAFNGVTNLPDEAELLVTLTNENGFRAQSKASVKDGKFTTEQFTKKGNALESGTYNVSVTMGIASTQNEAVQEIIGKSSEYLTGQLIEDGELGKTVSFDQTITIEGAEQVDHQALIKEFKSDIEKHYDEINSVYEKHRQSFDASEWGAFARDFREATNSLKDEIDESALNTSERIEVGPAVTHLQFLLTAYAADLQDRGDQNEIDRLKAEINQVIGQ